MFDITDEQMAIVDAVSTFVDRELVPHETTILEREAEGGHGGLLQDEKRALQDKAKASGLWGIDTPEEYGGVDLDWVTQALINIELGKTFISFRFGGSAPAVLYLGNEDQKARYLVPTIEGDKVYSFMLSEPGTASDARNISATAIRDGDDWVINGEKTWITRGNHADYGLVFCRTPEEDTADGELTAFLVDREMGWKSSPIRLMGRSDTASVSFVDVRVPGDQLFGEVGEGLPIAMRFIHKNRAVMTAGRQIGAAERLLGMAIDHAKQRVTFGEPLAHRENIRFMIAESEIEIRATKLLALNAASLADQGKDMRHAACATKYFGANAANRVVDRVMQIHGAMGVSREMPIERWFRDLRIERIYEGSDEMNLLAISRNLLNGNVMVGDIFQA